jgi:acetyl-CoA carboxylase carboxyltransferase component
MSSKERRAEKAREWEEEQRKADIERHRRENLTMWERIEEFVKDEELKNILHALAEHTGLED